MTALSSILSEIAEQRRKEAEEEDEEDDEDDEDDEDEEYDDEEDTGALGAKTFDDSDLETLAKQVPASCDTPAPIRWPRSVGPVDCLPSPLSSVDGAATLQTLPLAALLPAWHAPSTPTRCSAVARLSQHALLVCNVPCDVRCFCRRRGYALS